MLRPENLNQLAPINAAAALAEVHEDTLRRWIREGRIRAWGMRGCYRVNLGDLMPLVQPTESPRTTRIKTRNRIPVPTSPRVTQAQSLAALRQSLREALTAVNEMICAMEGP